MILFAHNPHYTRENYAEIVDDDIEDKRTKPEDREEAFSKFIFAELNTDDYGEGGQVPATDFMIVTTSNMKKSDLGKGFVLKNALHIDDLLQPLIMTNHYLSIRQQLPTFHADNVIAGDTDWIEKDYIKHLDKHF